MKKYIIRLLKVSALFVALVIVMAICRSQIIRHHSWSLPEDVHILFMGASHINHAIDDSMMKSAINWTRGSERYMYTYIKLQHLLPENPQVDTIFLELAPTDLWDDTDYKYHVLNEQSGYVKLYWPFYSLEQWEIFITEPVQVASLVANSLGEMNALQQKKWWEMMGNYNNVAESLDTTTVVKAPVENSGCGHIVNYDYLRRIITLCREYKVKLYFLETPTFHPEYFYDQKYFYKAYREHFSDVEFIDYSKWPMDPSERYDAHHLNHKGAVRFTQEIKDRFNIQ